MSLGPEVGVNCVSPGWIAHGPVSRKDHALLSEAAGFINAQNFVVDGGMTRKMIYR